MGETAFRKRLCQEIIAGGFTVHRIENFTEPGTPDIYFTDHERIAGWIETKVVRSFKFGVEVRKYQEIWIERHMDAGGLVFLCARDRAGRVRLWRAEKPESCRVRIFWSPCGEFEPEEYKSLTLAITLASFVAKGEGQMG